MSTQHARAALMIPWALGYAGNRTMVSTYKKRLMMKMG